MCSSLPMPDHSASMMNQPETGRQITCKGKEYIDRTAEVLTEAFYGDPVFTWLLLDYPLAEQKPVLARLLRFFFAAASLNKAIFLEVDGFGCAAVLMPPGCRVDNPWTMIPAGLIPSIFHLGLGYFKRALFEYASVTHRLMPKAFTKAEQERHWYLFIMATAVDRRREGLATEILVHIQDRARADGNGNGNGAPLPIWLEATTELSRDLYRKHGFTVVAEVVLGKGRVGRDGVPKEGGEGVTIWAMCWRP
ncbi:hypothetical protein VTK26DRAFT_85 [Humicola hyalothermophila]